MLGLEEDGLAGRTLILFPVEERQVLDVGSRQTDEHCTCKYTVHCIYVYERRRKVRCKYETCTVQKKGNIEEKYCERIPVNYLPVVNTKVSIILRCLDVSLDLGNFHYYF